MRDPLRAFPAVPLVGQRKTCDIHDIRVLALVSCACGQGKPFLIDHIDRKGRCTACGSEFVITNVQMRQKPDSLELHVNVERLERVVTPGDNERVDS